MGAVVWLSVAAALGLVLVPRTRNAGYFALAGTVLGCFLHFGIAWIPEVTQAALLLWAAAIALAASKLLPARRPRRTV